MPVLRDISETCTKGLTCPATSVPCADQTSQPCHRSSSPAFHMEVKARLAFWGLHIEVKLGFGGTQHVQTRSAAEGPDLRHELLLSQREDL